MSFRRSGEPFKASDHYSDIWYRCGVTNFGTQPVRNLRAKFPVQFAEAEPTQNGAQSGTILANGYALTPSIDLGTGSGGSDYFYFANASPAFIEVSVPTTAILQTLTDDEWHVVKLIPPSPGKAAFSLIPSTNPLNVRHPAPAAAPTPPETKDGSSAISEQSGRRYTKTDAERMLSALFELYDTLNSNVDAVGRIEGFWLSPSQQMQGKTTKEKVAIAAQTREHVRNISKDIYNTIMPKYQYYAEDLRPLIQGDGVIGQANGVLNEFIEAADVLPADANEQLIKLALESKQAKLDSVMSDFVRWAGDSKTRISSKRSEIESHEK